MIGYLVALAVGAAAGWMARQMLAPAQAPAASSGGFQSREPATSSGEVDQVRQQCAQAMAELEAEFSKRLEAIAEVKKGS